eukprot:TRINITY_DN17319_c0_g1_i2.p1 TRINITY_DN17319_c0_g1~~TRINITY_DN17319_c0_g1_i2.p1  ORF type:complete len:168 (-),score=37.05 TRINITY_DN17319_c0_g1_i2:34-537(-)
MCIRDRLKDGRLDYIGSMLEGYVRSREVVERYNQKRVREVYQEFSNKVAELREQIRKTEEYWNHRFESTINCIGENKEACNKNETDYQLHALDNLLKRMEAEIKCFADSNNAKSKYNYCKDDIMKSVKHSLNELCLLYTSPSPRDLSTSRMPSSACKKKKKQKTKKK